MRIYNEYYFLQLKHSVRLLRRYQQIGYYFVIIPLFLLLPILMGAKEKYTLLILFTYFIFVLWVFSPFYLNQFSLSYDDQRSLAVFPLNWKAIVWSRNAVNIVMLLLIMILSVLIIRIIYLKDSAYLLHLFIYAILNILPLITIGNKLSVKSSERARENYFSWTSLLVFPVVLLNYFYLSLAHLFLQGFGYFITIILALALYIAIYMYSVKALIKKHHIISPEKRKSKK